MNKFINKLITKHRLSIIILLVLLIPSVYYIFFYHPPTTGDWQTQLAIPSTAEFNDNLITIKNIRNFRYEPTEEDMHPAYYDQTYDLTRLKQVWYVTEPFNGEEYAAHTFLSFEFDDGKFISLTIEARKTNSQAYKPWLGMLRSYPLIYVAADERDTILLRANLRKDKVYVYPVKTSKENGQKLFVDMLEEMNRILEKPVWYHTLFANCTSRIAYHVNRVTPNRVNWYSWQLWLTGSADKLALDLGLLDTELPISEARTKYQINERSIEIGDNENYSKFIRVCPQ